VTRRYYTSALPGHGETSWGFYYPVGGRELSAPTFSAEYRPCGCVVYPDVWDRAKVVVYTLPESGRCPECGKVFQVLQPSIYWVQPPTGWRDTAGRALNPEYKVIYRTVPWS
jgi:hypothetical protein